VCITGQMRALRKTADGIIRHVIAPGNADLFISTSKEVEYDMLYLLRNQTTSLNAIPADLDLSNWWKKQAGPDNKGFETIVGSENSEFVSGLSPREGYGDHQHYHLYQCSRMIQEKEKARGKAYDVVHFLRSDMLFTADAIPTSLVQGSNVCYCPTSPENFPGSISDFEAICDRVGADAYMSTVSLLTENPQRVLKGLPTWRNTNQHSWLHWRLKDSNTTIKNLVSLGFLTCNSEEVEMTISDSTESALIQTGTTPCVHDEQLNIDFKSGASNDPFRIQAPQWSRLVKSCGWSEKLVSLADSEEKFAALLEGLQGKDDVDSLCDYHL